MSAWLLRYGPKMFKTCVAQEEWLGRPAFSTLQAACFPEYFALQVPEIALDPLDKDFSPH